GEQARAQLEATADADLRDRVKVLAGKLEAVHARRRGHLAEAAKAREMAAAHLARTDRAGADVEDLRGRASHRTRVALAAEAEAEKCEMEIAALEEQRAGSQRQLLQP